MEELSKNMLLELAMKDINFAISYSEEPTWNEREDGTLFCEVKINTWDKDGWTIELGSFYKHITKEQYETYIKEKKLKRICAK